MAFQQTYEEALEKRRNRPSKPRKPISRGKDIRRGTASLGRKGGLKATPTVGSRKSKKTKRAKVPKTAKVQTLFNTAVKERGNWICVVDGEDFSAPDRRRFLHASHFWGVGFTATRFDFDNVDPVCYVHHYGSLTKGWEYLKHADYRDYMIRKLGQDGYDALERKARTGMKLLDAKLEFLGSLKTGNFNVGAYIDQD